MECCYPDVFIQGEGLVYFIKTKPDSAHIAWLCTLNCPACNPDWSITDNFWHIIKSEIWQTQQKHCSKRRLTSKLQQFVSRILDTGVQCKAKTLKGICKPEKTTARPHELHCLNQQVSGVEMISTEWMRCKLGYPPTLQSIVDTCQIDSYSKEL